MFASPVQFVAIQTDLRKPEYNTALLGAFLNYLIRDKHRASFASKEKQHVIFYGKRVHGSKCNQDFCDR